MKRWLHVGCDEVFHLGQCPLCQDVMSRRNSDPKAGSSSSYYDGRALFLDHAVRVGEHVRNKYKGKKQGVISHEDIITVRQKRRKV